MELRLATFNLENLGIRHGEESRLALERLPRHVEAVRGVLERLDADAVAVQEILAPELLAELAGSLGYPHVVIGERGSSPLLLGVLSRYPLQAACSVAKRTALSLSDGKTGLTVQLRGDFSRPVLRVVWAVPGFRTTLFVVHWKSKIPSPVPDLAGGANERWRSHAQAGEGRLLTELKRLGQAVELRREIDAALTGEGGGRVVVLGDFNDSLDSECLRILRGDSRSCHTPELVPTELLACEASVPEDRRFSQIYRGQKQMPDHVLISRPLLPHLGSTSIFNEDVEDAVGGPVTDPFRVASDHAAVVVTFRVREG